MAGIVDPAMRALAQCDEPAFFGVVLRSVAWSALVFIALGTGVGYAFHMALTGHGLLSGLGPVFGVIITGFAALFLFMPLAAAVASLFVERIAAVVEARWYPALPPARPAPLAQQVWDSLWLGLRVAAMQLLAVVFAFFLPGIGFILGWAVGSWAIGRGLFMAVAMRRMERRAAVNLYKDRRLAVVAQGGAITAAGLIPVVNLFGTVLGIAALVHVMHAPDEEEA